MFLFLQPSVEQGSAVQSNSEITSQRAEQQARFNADKRIESHLMWYEERFKLTDEQKLKLRELIEMQVRTSEKFSTEIEALFTEEQVKQLRSR